MSITTNCGLMFDLGDHAPPFPRASARACRHSG
jgi:hypothetical protein